MKTILILLDTDNQPSSFDRVVSVDAGVDHLFSYSQVTPENVTALVHGAMFTRGVSELKSTAIFIGGSNIDAGEALLKTIKKTFFGPVRVSVMLDSNGSNTTAAAAVLRLKEQLPLQNLKVAVLAGTGPVGFRVAQILLSQGSEILLTSRTLDKAKAACENLRLIFPDAKVAPVAYHGTGTLEQIQHVEALVSCGAAGVQFLSVAELSSFKNLKVAIDINAVPPVGLEGIGPNEKAGDHVGYKGYGALSVGSLKMRIHKAAVMQLFQANDQVLNTNEIFHIGLNTK